MVIFGTAFFAHASVLQASYEASTLYSDMYNSGSNGYSHIRFIVSGTVHVKTLITATDCNVGEPGNMIDILGNGILTVASTSVVTDEWGHDACAHYFTGSGSDVTAGTYYFSGGVNTGLGGDWYGAASGSASETGRGNLGFHNFTPYGSGGERAYVVCSTAECEFSAPVSDTTTHFDTITPASGDTIATSSAASFGADGYINPNDYSDGMYIQMKYVSYSAMQASVASPDSLYTVLEFPISSSGTFHVSTTSPALTLGEYTMQSSIRSNSWLDNALNFFGFGQFAGYGIKTATSTTFIADSLSGYDVFVASTTASIETYLASSTISLASCSSWTSFNLGDCMNLLFVPQTKPISDALGNFKNGFLQYAPWGYLTRVVVILSGTATSSLPAFSTTIQLGSPTDTDTFSFDMQDMITGGYDLLNSIPANGSSMSVQDIIEPFIQLFVALFVIIVIIRDLTGAGHRGTHNFGHNGRE